jgi:hypothetical protein
MAEMTTNGAPTEGDALPGHPAAQPIETERTGLELYLKAVYGNGTGYAIAAFGKKPYLTSTGAYRHTTWREAYFPWPSQRGELVEKVLLEVAAGADVYVCPYLTRDKTRKKGRAVERRLIHADIDGAVPVEKVQALGGYAVASGTEGHGHVYVALSAPVDARQHEALCRGLGRYLEHADAKISDNDLLRPPGTLNHKSTVASPPGQPLLVRWLVKP